MVLFVAQPTLDINSQISALQTQEELLHKSLDNLRGDRKTVKAYRTCDKELAEVTRRRQALVALAQFEVGMGVYKPGTSLSGTITEIRITPGGLGEVWVSWESGVSIPEQPINIKLAIACEHNFRGIWQANGTLIGYCDCGIMRSPTRDLLALHLDNCRQVRCDYAAKVIDGQPPTFVQAVERIDKQIQWLEEHLLQQPSNVGETPAPDFRENTDIDNSAATLGNHSFVAAEVWNGGGQQLLPTLEIQERLIDTSTGSHDTRLSSLGDDKAHSFSDSELIDNQDKAALIQQPHLGKEYLTLEFIAIDGGTQSRAYLNDSTVDEYAEALDAGAEFPPILVFYDGEKYWLADGFHRVAAAKKMECGEIVADVRSGTRRDAVLYSVGANATHGLRRTNADKRRAVLTLLGDEEWSCWSDREVARRCGVSTPFASKLRSELSVNGLQIDNSEVSVNNRPIERTVTRNGTTYTMDATKIGKNDAALRSELSVNGLQIVNSEVSVNNHPIEHTVTCNGTTYTVDATKIGKNDAASIANEGMGTGSAELPGAKFKDIEARTGQEFNTINKDQREPVTDLLPLTSDEITISVVSNVEILSNQQLMLVLKTIETELSKRNTKLNSD